MTNIQIDKKLTKQIRIDAGLHQELKVYASKSRMTIKALLEDYLSDLLAIDRSEVYLPKKKYSASLESPNVTITQAEQKPVQGNTNDNGMEAEQN